MRLISGLTLALAFLTFSPGIAIACEGMNSAFMSDAKIKVATIAAKIIASEKAKQAPSPVTSE